MDYQWTYAMKKHDALSINPTKNLVTNIGFGPEALNTKDKYSHLSNLPLESMEEITHPASIKKDKNADRYLFYNNVCGRYCLVSILIKIFFHLKNRCKVFFTGNTNN